MRILIAGGVGYAGSVVAEELIAAKHEIIILEQPAKEKNRLIPPSTSYVQGSLSDCFFIEGVFREYRGIECVIYFATNTSTEESLRMPELYLRDNVSDGVNLLSIAIKHDVRQFILVSSVKVYGNPVPVPIIEESYINPVNPYGGSLYSLERVLMWYERLLGLHYGILRCFNLAGATGNYGGQFQRANQLIPGLLTVAKGQKPFLNLYGENYHTPDGSCIRDYVHVKDFARAISVTLPALKERSRIYNVGSGKGYSNKEVIEAARRITGHPIPCQIKNEIAFEPVVQIASIETINRELGWKPEYSELDFIIKSEWDWKLNN